MFHMKSASGDYLTPETTKMANCYRYIVTYITCLSFSTKIFYAKCLCWYLSNYSTIIKKRVQMSKLDELLQFYEKNLDMNHVESTKKRLKALHNYEAADKISLHVDYPNTETTGYSYKDAFDDMEKMMYNGLRNYTNNVIDIKDDTVPMIRAGYGVGILPSLFGVNCRTINNNAPWVDQVENEDEIKKIIDKGVPDLRSGLGARYLTHMSITRKTHLNEKCRRLYPFFIRIFRVLLMLLT